jgi:hypothetical protein
MVNLWECHLYVVDEANLKLGLMKTYMDLRAQNTLKDQKQPLMIKKKTSRCIN